MKLSVELEKWRADRPDEWKMDEFIRNAEKLESENDALSQKLRAAQHEAEALAATVEALSSKLKEVAALVDGDGFSAIQWILDNHAEVGQLALAPPQQHLRDVRSEAGKQGWDACVDWIIETTSSKVFSGKEAFVAYDIGVQYAESVRAGVK